MNILVTICARAGSKRLPGKNVKLFHDKPLIAWTIQQALAFKSQIDEDQTHTCAIVICTDIDLCAHSYEDFATSEEGWIVPILDRPEKLNGDNVPKLDVIRYVLQRVEKSPCCEGIDCVIDLDVTNPCRLFDDIKSAFEAFLSRQVSVMFSVTPARKSPYFNQVETVGFGGFKKYKLPGGSFMFGDSRSVWDMNAAILIVEAEWLRDKKNIHPVCLNSEIYLMEDWQAFDIDTEIDFQIAELMFWKHLLCKPLVKSDGIWT